ncbi:MAG: hypothetical protein DRR19_00250 [Candidatus Parabeggiatoa sp. nov. 1]|nr:MAG: hypothetical protein DRR19_00250 [Gammaproteobacteria bacterium]
MPNIQVFFHPQDFGSKENVLGDTQKIIWNKNRVKKDWVKSTQFNAKASSPFQKTMNEYPTKLKFDKKGRTVNYFNR